MARIDYTRRITFCFFVHLSFAFCRHSPRLLLWIMTLRRMDSQFPRSVFWLFLFREEFVGRDLSLFVTLLFDLLVDSPLVAERIDDLCVPSSPEHVLHGHAHARTSSYRTLHYSVGIVN